MSVTQHLTLVISLLLILATIPSAVVSTAATPDVGVVKGDDVGASAVKGSDYAEALIGSAPGVGPVAIEPAGIPSGITSSQTRENSHEFTTGTGYFKVSGQRYMPYPLTRTRSVPDRFSFADQNDDDSIARYEVGQAIAAFNLNVPIDGNVPTRIQVGQLLAFYNLGDPPDESPVTVSVDDSGEVIPDRDTIRRVENNESRPVGRIENDQGTGNDFVADEVIVNEQMSVARRLADRWNGTIRDSIEPTAQHLSFTHK